MREYYKTFLAIPVYPGVTKRINRWLHPHATALGLRTVPPENRHLTVAFLGETPVELIAPIAEALSSRLSGSRTGELSLEGIGVFPVSGTPRVLWAGCVETQGWLRHLYETVREVLNEFGYPGDKSGFTPHVTLSRIKADKGKAVLEIVKDGQGPHFGSWVPDALIYYSSVAEKGGVVYSTLATIPL